MIGYIGILSLNGAQCGATLTPTYSFGSLTMVRQNMAEMRVFACHSERSLVILSVSEECMDYPHRHPERVTTSYPIALCFSVSGGCHTHRCRDTMCWPSPGREVGNPYKESRDPALEILR